MLQNGWSPCSRCSSLLSQSLREWTEHREEYHHGSTQPPGNQECKDIYVVDHYIMSWFCIETLSHFCTRKSDITGANLIIKWCQLHYYFIIKWCQLYLYFITCANFIFAIFMITWKYFLRYWPLLVRGIHQWLAVSPNEMPEIQSFEIFFDVSLNKLFTK